MLTLTADECRFVREIVQATANVMDDVRPGWYADVDKDRLQLGDTRHCIIGQVWPTRDFTVVWNELRPLFIAEFEPGEAPVDDGWFTIAVDGSGRADVTPAEISYTETCWRDEIDARWRMDQWLTELSSETQVRDVSHRPPTPSMRLVALPTT